MKTKNLFKVNKRRWNKLSELARHVFNNLYKQMVDSPWAFQPRRAMIKNSEKAGWKVTAWNSAWIAADEVMAGLKIIEAEFFASIDKTLKRMESEAKKSEERFWKRNRK
jgi:hypothetical protein